MCSAVVVSMGCSEGGLSLPTPILSEGFPMRTYRLSPVFSVIATSGRQHSFLSCARLPLARLSSCCYVPRVGAERFQSQVPADLRPRPACCHVNPGAPVLPSPSLLRAPLPLLQPGPSLRLLGCTHSFSRKVSACARQGLYAESRAEAEAGAGMRAPGGERWVLGARLLSCAVQAGT